MKRLFTLLATPFVWLADLAWAISFLLFCRSQIQAEEEEAAADRADAISRAVRHPYASRPLPSRSYP